MSITRLLALSPRLIVADEPLSALDVSMAAQVANLMRELEEKLGLTYLFISHDLQMVELIVHRVGVMYLGQAVETAPAKALGSQASTPLFEPLVVRGRCAQWKKTVWQRRCIELGAFGKERTTEGCRFRARCPVDREKGEPALCREERHRARAHRDRPGPPCGHRWRRRKIGENGEPALPRPHYLFVNNNQGGIG